MDKDMKMKTMPALNMLPDSLGEAAIRFKEKQGQAMKLVAPVAKRVFSKRSLNELVKAFNGIAPMFGLQETYPDFTADVKELPVDFVKMLSMVGNATRDALRDEAIDSPLLVSLADITDDNGLLNLTGKLIMLGKDRFFKQWLSEAPAPDEGEGEDDMGAPDMGAPDDDLMSALMKRG